MKRYLTVADYARVHRMSESTVRRRAEALGGFKLPGCRRWLFEPELKKKRTVA